MEKGLACGFTSLENIQEGQKGEEETKLGFSYLLIEFLFC